MKYPSIAQAEWIERINRFTAYVKLNDKIEKIHVKNTGRCRELLVPGARVWLTHSDKKERATAYDLVTVEKNGRLVNVDSQAPNQVVGEWLLQKKLFPDLVSVRPETCYGNSRFDFYLETEEQKIFLEVKGVTSEENGVVSFPDAPSERAVKHMRELIQARREGFRACVIFVIQMKGAAYFRPAREIQPAFAEALTEAATAGVEVYAYDCNVAEDKIEIDAEVPVRLENGDQILTEISAPLLMWYDANKRILPWRDQPDAYRIWVSEIMLQQTRVEAVKPYFERFMKALPNVEVLAGAEEEMLLKLWEGLGYYTRVRNLQKAAVQIMSQFDGKIPSSYADLLTLCGIGSYTAGAIASIGFGEAVPAVDGNVMRVVARLCKDERLISDAQVKRQVEQEVGQIIPGDRPGDFNQAMMELGACVCIPNGAPLCDKCPLAGLCLAHGDGTELDYPRKAHAKGRKIEKKTVLLIRDAEYTVIRKRPEKGLLAGMYEFPWLDGFRTAEEVIAYLERNGVKTIRIVPLEDVKHIFTHKEWHMKGYVVQTDELEQRNPGTEIKDWIYIRPEETKDQYPMPSAFGAYMKRLQMKLDKPKHT